MTGWLGSLLHSTTDAVAPGVNPVPATVMTSPLTRPVQMGSKTLALLHVPVPGPPVTERASVVPGVLTVDA
jgi:hypothetical protein